MARPFRERLREAAAYAGIEYSQTAIARSLDITKQSVDNWMGEGEPRPAMIFRMADRWNVSPRWLATEQGQMVGEPPTGGTYSKDEVALVRRHRKASPQVRAALKVMLKLAMLLCFILPNARDADAFNKTEIVVSEQRSFGEITRASCATWLSGIHIAGEWLMQAFCHFFKRPSTA